MRTVAMVSVSRSDYGIYKPLLFLAKNHPELKIQLWVAAMHLCPEFGMTVREIEADKIPIAERIPMTLASDEPEGASKSFSVGVMGFAQAIARRRPDLLMVLGDRFEMLAAVAAALPFVLPVAHLHGGETTEGVIDDSIRHAISKMSHLHFVATEVFRRRLIQMGEEPWRVCVSGAPSLDKIRTTPMISLKRLENELGISLHLAPLLVTLHPETLRPGMAIPTAKTMFLALEKTHRPVIVTAPNADVEGRELSRFMQEWVAKDPRSRTFVHSLGSDRYFSLLRCAKAMVGNSSSGIIEAGSFSLPVVNIGDRQAGRLKGPHVIDVLPSSNAILTALRQAESSAFKKLIQNKKNLYGDGQASRRIISVLTQISLGEKLTRKRFHSPPTMQKWLRP